MRKLYFILNFIILVSDSAGAIFYWVQMGRGRFCRQNRCGIRVPKAGLFCSRHTCIDQPMKSKSKTTVAKKIRPVPDKDPIFEYEASPQLIIDTDSLRKLFQSNSSRRYRILDFFKDRPSVKEKVFNYCEHISRNYVDLSFMVGKGIVMKCISHALFMPNHILYEVPRLPHSLLCLS